MGIVLGVIASSLFSARVEVARPPMAEEIELPERASDSKPAKKSLEQSPSPTDREERTTSLPETLENGAIAPESTIPSVYRDVIGQPRPRRLMVADRHADFLREPRDESWATAMEAGIWDQIADNAENIQFRVEHVECRSNHCEVGGYVLPGLEDDSRELRDGLKTAGWWQGGLSSASTRKKIDGTTRVVILFNRHGAWTEWFGFKR